MFILIPTGAERSVYGMPWFTIGTIAICAFVWLAMITGYDAIGELGYRPVDRLHPNLLFCMYVHGGLFHLAGNMIFLWCMGVNLEARWGPIPFAILYLVGGVAASMSFGGLHPTSETPLVGASGAIAAAMGAFLISMYKTKIRMAYFWFLFFRAGAGSFKIRAYIILPLWFALDLLGAYGEAKRGASGVAYSAHVGGFVLGFLATGALRLSGAEKSLMAKRGSDIWDEPNKWTEVEAVSRGEASSYIPSAPPRPLSSQPPPMTLPDASKPTRCPGCGLVNMPGLTACRRCQEPLS